MAQAVVRAWAFQSVQFMLTPCQAWGLACRALGAIDWKVGWINWNMPLEGVPFLALLSQLLAMSPVLKFDSRRAISLSTRGLTP